MIAEVADKRDEIVALCRRFGVRRLELFGSAARGDFDPATSDFDFILELDSSRDNLPGRFIGFGEALEELLGRSVDFVFDRMVKNPYLRASIDATRELIYDDGTAGEREVMGRDGRRQASAGIHRASNL